MIRYDQHMQRIFSPDSSETGSVFRSNNGFFHSWRLEHLDLTTFLWRGRYIFRNRKSIVKTIDQLNTNTNSPHFVNAIEIGYTRFSCSNSRNLLKDLKSFDVANYWVCIKMANTELLQRWSKEECSRRDERVFSFVIGALNNFQTANVLHTWLWHSVVWTFCSELQGNTSDLEKSFCEKLSIKRWPSN